MGYCINAALILHIGLTLSHGQPWKQEGSQHWYNIGLSSNNDMCKDSLQDYTVNIPDILCTFKMLTVFRLSQ